MKFFKDVGIFQSRRRKKLPSGEIWAPGPIKFSLVVPLTFEDAGAFSPINFEI
jgi:hypothetical protein